MSVAFDKHRGRAQYIFTAKKLIPQVIIAYCVSAVFDERHGHAQYFFMAKGLWATFVSFGQGWA